MRATPFDPDFVPDIEVVPRGRRTDEFVVRCWQDAFRTPSTAASSSRIQGKERADSDDATEVIASCKDDMKTLWEDKSVRTLPQKHNIRLQDSAGLCVPLPSFSPIYDPLTLPYRSFLDDLDRIATHSYEPSDDDILRARLRTLGVQEHRLHLDDANSDFVTKRAYSCCRPIVDKFYFLLLPVGMEYGREWIMYDVGGARTTVRVSPPHLHLFITE
jgi:guanine nucleotide-binding protein subunit alpha